jgi:hypothetical protein
MYPRALDNNMDNKTANNCDFSSRSLLWKGWHGSLYLSCHTTPCLTARKLVESNNDHKLSSLSGRTPSITAWDAINVPLFCAGFKRLSWFIVHFPRWTGDSGGLVRSGREKKSTRTLPCATLWDTFLCRNGLEKYTAFCFSVYLAVILRSRAGLFNRVSAGGSRISGTGGGCNLWKRALTAGRSPR